MDYKAIYNKNYFNGKDSFFWKLGYGRFAKFYFRNICKNVEKYIYPGQKILDAGCAYGYVLANLPEEVEKYGIDVSEYAINIAKSNIPEANLQVANLEEELLYEENFFDVIFLNDVIEHIENYQQALMHLKNILKIGGIIFITTPNTNMFRKKFLSFADKKEHHVSMFSHAKLMELLEKLDFEIIDHWTFFNPFNRIKLKSEIGLESAFICKKI